MQTINAYSYKNTLTVQFLDLTIFSVRNRVVYSRPIKIYQGIDNPLQVIILNQDQKPVNVTGYDVQLDIQDPDLGGAVASIAVTMSNVELGQGTTIISKNVVNALTARAYKLTVKLINQLSNLEQPLYLDSNYSCRIDLEVLDGWTGLTPVSVNPAAEVIDGGSI